jgi:hypothetical protein
MIHTIAIARVTKFHGRSLINMDSKLAPEYTTTLLSVCCLLVIVVYTVVNSGPTELFFWHPIMMSLSFFFTMIQVFLQILWT